MKFFKLSHITAGVLALSAGLAQAALVTDWIVTVDSRFVASSIVDSNGNTPGGVAISNADLRLRWGAPATANGQSGLDIINSDDPTLVTTDGPGVPNISIAHSNWPVFAPTLDSVDILSSLTLTPNTPPGSPLPAEFLTFNINFLETPNSPASGICADGGANGVGINSAGCADIFVIGNTALNFPFDYDTDGPGGDDPVTYFISFFEQTTGLNPLPTAACLAAGAPAGCLGFETRENQATTVTFATVITTAPIGVPEPGSLALAGLGLTALAGLGRRRKTLQA